jgi:YidC/Oxa1 family membrane protein insertase
MDTRRAILWAIFSISLLMLWDAYMRYSGSGSLFGPAEVSQPAPEPVASSGPVGVESPGSQATAGRPADVSIPNPTQPLVVTPAAPALPAAALSGVPSQSGAETSVERVVLTNEDIELEFDALGAKIIRAKLLDQVSDAYDDKLVTLFAANAQRLYEAQTGLIAGQGGGVLPNHTTTFRRVASDARSATFVAESGGVKLTKTFSIEAQGHMIRVAHTIQNTGADSVSPMLYMQLMRDGNRPPGESKFYQTFIGPAVFTQEGKFQKIDFSDVEKNKASHVKSASDGWVGIVQHYFVAAWVPQNALSREFYTRKIDTNLYAAGMIQPIETIMPGAQASHEAVLYAGPQIQKTLESLAPGLELVVDYGWLTFLAKPIYWLLEKLHGLVANWGWAIVLLTVIIKLIFYPLSAASYKSMAKMKAVSPRLVKLRELYANDKPKLNQAMMELYKTEKINPLGGCLPILIQIPVFLALYWVLLASVEMRNAPWLGWVTDLSVPDPYYILPVVMAITMFIQTKLNPPPPDPIQAKVMMFMPIVFSVFFFFFPAGLVLYWLVNNVLSIAQQWYVMRKLEISMQAKKA